MAGAWAVGKEAVTGLAPSLARARVTWGLLLQPATTVDAPRSPFARAAPQPLGSRKRLGNFWRAGES